MGDLNKLIKEEREEKSLNLLSKHKFISKTSNFIKETRKRTCAVMLSTVIVMHTILPTAGLLVQNYSLAGVSYAAVSSDSMSTSDSDDEVLIDMQISTAKQLLNFAKEVNNGKDYSGYNIILKNDIDLSSICSSSLNKSWTPIGKNASNAFKGNFNGNGKTISGLYINNSTNVAGLFGYNEGKIENLNVSGSINVVSTQTNRVGGIAAENSDDGVIKNCTNNINITVKGSTSESDGANCIGGITSVNYGIVSYSTNQGKIEVENKNGLSNDLVGGIVGNCRDGVINRCTNEGSVSDEQNSDKYRAYVGGIVGFESENSKIKNSNNTANVTATGKSPLNSVGGIAGVVASSVLNKVYNTGKVTGENSENNGYVGGIVGFCSNGSAMVKNTYNKGEVCSENETGKLKNVGGIVGGLGSGDNKGSVINCYNLGNVHSAKASDQTNVGSIVGRLYCDKSSITFAFYVAGRISGDQNSNDGDEAVGNYKQGASKAERKTTAMSEDDMRTKTFADQLGENINKPGVWTYDENRNEGYPILTKIEPEKSTVDGIVYEIDDDEAIVVGYEGDSKAVVIPEKLEDVPVTLIQEDSFKEKNITEVTIPASVRKVGKQAFRNCTSLTKVTFAKGSELKTISTRAFAGCTKLSSISLPSTVTKIRKSSFRKCSSLTEIKIPNATTYIGITAFAECTSLKKVTISANSKLETIRSGAFRGDTALVNIGDSSSFKGDIPLNKMPDSLNGVSALEDSVFKGCTSLQSISLNINTIPESCFENCTKLKRVHTRTSKTVKVGQSAFAGCSKLVSVYARISSIGDNAFSGCSSMNRITVSTDVKLASKAKLENIFKGHKSDFKVYAMGNTKNTDFGDLFTTDTKMENVTVSSKKAASDTEGTNKSIAVTIKGKENLYPLDGWDISADRKTLTKVFTSYVKDDTKVTVEDTAGNTVQKTLDLSGLAKLVPTINVNFEKDTDYVKNDVKMTVTITTFQKTTLKSLQLKQLTSSGIQITDLTSKVSGKNGTYTYTGSIGNGAYALVATDSSGNDNSQPLYIAFVDKEAPEITNTNHIGYIDLEIKDKAIKSVIIKNKDTNEEEEAAYSKNEAQSETFNVTNHRISKSGNYKVTVTDEAGNVTEKDLGYVEAYVTTEDGFQIAFTNNILAITGLSNEYKQDTLIIPNTLKYNGTEYTVGGVTENAINNSYIKTIIVEDNVDVIFGNSFIGCKNLKKLIIESASTEIEDPKSGTTYEELQEFASKIRVISFPFGRAFYWGESYGSKIGMLLNGVIYELNRSTKTATVYGAHYRNGPETQVTISETVNIGEIYTVTKIGESAFANSLVEKVTLPSTITEIGDNAFEGAQKLKEINVENVQKIGRKAFASSGLERFTFTDKMSIGEYAFYNCQKLKTVENFDKLSEIPAGLFANCEKLETELAIKEGITDIGYEAFASCKALTKITLPSTLTNISSGAFRETGLNEIKLPDALEYIQSMAFYECASIKKVIIPKSVKDIGKAAFQNCSNLNKVEFKGDSINEIKCYAFTQCNIKSVIIPNITGGFGLEERAPGSYPVFDSDTVMYYDKINTSTLPNYQYALSINPYIPEDQRSCIIMGYETTEDGQWDYTIEKIKEQIPSEAAVTDDGDGEEFTADTEIDEQEKEIISIIKYNGEEIDVEVPDNISDRDVGKIGSETFNEKEKIETIIIPKSVDIIEDNQFSGCINLKKIIILNDGIDLRNNTSDLFKDCPNVILYVGVASNGHIWAEKNWAGKYRLISRHVVYGDVDETNNTANVVGTIFEQRNIEVPEKIGSGKYEYQIKKINQDSFANSTTLENVFIMDRNIEMNTDTQIFATNTDITIYCWENSTAHKYAVARHIKFVFLEYGMDAVAIEFDSAAIKLKIGEEESLTYWIYPSIAKQEVVWSSSNEKVVTVKDGLVTGIANGVAIVTVSAANNPDVKATCEITVGTGTSDEDYLLGDTNGDGKRSTIDKLYMSRHIYAKNNNTHSDWILTGTRLKAANINSDKDSNGDEEINAQDKLQLARYLAAQYDKVIAERHPEWTKLPNGDK